MKKSILLIVDDWEAHERYEDFFTKHFHVTCAPFAKTGFELIQNSELQFEIILVDLSFEDVSPLEFLQRYSKIRKHKHPKLLVILDEGGHDIREMKLLLSQNEHLIPRPFQWSALLNQYLLGDS
ncbi:MAG: hypothetical protein KA715_08840 [Xanthomonadaceae bacterium]|nr:hypothetical protein [Xanthomonadaceae bacterium]